MSRFDWESAAQRERRRARRPGRIKSTTVKSDRHASFLQARLERRRLEAERRRGGVDP